MAEMYNSDLYYASPPSARKSFAFPPSNFSPINFSSHHSLLNNANPNQPYHLSNSYFFSSRPSPFQQGQLTSPQNRLTSLQNPHYQSPTQALSSLSQNQYSLDKLPFAHSQSSSPHSTYIQTPSSITPLSNSHSPRPGDAYLPDSTLPPPFTSLLPLESTSSSKSENYLNLNSSLYPNQLPMLLAMQDQSTSNQPMYLPLDRPYSRANPVMTVAETEYYDMSPSNTNANNLPPQQQQQHGQERLTYLTNSTEAALSTWNPPFFNSQYPSNFSLPYNLPQPSDVIRRSSLPSLSQSDQMPYQASQLLIAQNQNLSAINSASSIPRPLPPVMLSNIYLSVIHCGIINPVTGTRLYTQHCSYWNQEMDVYSAVNDPAQRILFRAALLSDRFQCATNKVGMYLARRRGVQGGIFQATGFEYKPESGGKGLKVAAYFITREACVEFEKHWRVQAIKRVKRTLRESKLENNESEKRLKKETNSTSSSSAALTISNTTQK